MKQRTEEGIQKAEGDWRIAQCELDSEEPVWDEICFHTQQCAEK
jgi:HEPN domain-containing protein